VQIRYWSILSLVGVLAANAHGQQVVAPGNRVVTKAEADARLLGMATRDAYPGWLQEPPPRRDLFQLAVTTPLPASPWFDRERALFSDLLRSRRSSWVIAPVQIQGLGIDRTTRSLMTAKLTRRAAGAAPDAYIVQRALGDGRRTIPGVEVGALADKLDAAMILSTFVGHDNANHLIVTAVVDERDRAGAGWRRVGTKTWSDIAFSDENPPMLVFDALVPKLLEFAGIAVTPTSTDRASRPYQPFFPANPHDAIAAAERGALQRAAILQLLGTLAPAAPERYRERLFERSLLALEGVDDKRAIAVETARLLRARAFYYLNTRPVAKLQLAGASTAEGRAFAAFLDGNQPGMEREIAGVKDELLRCMLEFDLQDMRVEYRVTPESNLSPFIQGLAKRFPEWVPWLIRRVDEKD
jgi:hypothetical protein